MIRNNNYQCVKIISKNWKKKDEKQPVYIYRSAVILGKEGRTRFPRTWKKSSLPSGGFLQYHLTAKYPFAALYSSRLPIFSSMGEKS